MKQVLTPIIIPSLNLTRVFVIMGVVSYIAFLTLQIFQRKEYIYLGCFGCFFLFSAFQLSLATFFEEKQYGEYADRLFGSALIMFFAAIFSLVDLSCDLFLKIISNYKFLVTLISMFEYGIALLSISLVLISLEKTRLVIKSFFSN